MRVSVQYSGVSHVRVERIADGEGGHWHKLYITDCKGDTDEVCLFGKHDFTTNRRCIYHDIGWRGFDAVLTDSVAAECDALEADIAF